MHPSCALRATALLLSSLAITCGSPRALPYSGFVDEPVSAVATQASGKVDAVRVREGDRVHKGELLAQIDSAEREAIVAQAEASLERTRKALEGAEANFRVAVPGVSGAGADVARARATLEQARLDFERVEKLVASGSLPQADFDAARARRLEAEAAVDSLLAAKAQTQGRVSAAAAAVEDARAGVHTADAALQLAKVQLDQTHILAPFDGVVVSRNLEEGEWAAPGAAVVTVEDTSRPWVRLDIEETSFGGLQLGAPARIHVVALGSREFGGHVSQVGAEGDFAINRDVKRGRPDIRTFLVRVAFDAPPAELRPGMTADVTLTGGPASTGTSVAASP